VQEPILRIPTLAIHLDRTISSEGRKINNQSHLVLVLATSIKNEMQKIVEENGPIESSENKNTKHHPLLLHVSSLLPLQTYSSTNSYKKYILIALGYEESSTDFIFCCS